MKRAIVLTLPSRADRDIGKVMVVAQVRQHIGIERSRPGWIATFNEDIEASGDTIEEACDALGAVLIS